MQMDPRIPHTRRSRFGVPRTLGWDLLEFGMSALWTAGFTAGRHPEKHLTYIHNSGIVRRMANGGLVQSNLSFGSLPNSLVMASASFAFVDTRLAKSINHQMNSLAKIWGLQSPSAFEKAAAAEWLTHLLVENESLTARQVKARLRRVSLGQMVHWEVLFNTALKMGFIVNSRSWRLPDEHPLKSTGVNGTNITKVELAPSVHTKGTHLITSGPKAGYVRAATDTTPTNEPPLIDVVRGIGRALGLISSGDSVTVTTKVTIS